MTGLVAARDLIQRLNTPDMLERLIRLEQIVSYIHGSVAAHFTFPPPVIVCVTYMNK